MLDGFCIVFLGSRTADVDGCGWPAAILWIRVHAQPNSPWLSQQEAEMHRGVKLSKIYGLPTDFHVSYVSCSVH